MATPERVFNFSAGPACLPVEVLQESQADLLSYKGSGMSVMEMSHRSKEFEGIIKAAEQDLRALLSIPDNYKVLFLQGGASTQFAALALNFAAPGDAADYVVTGAWSKKAYEEGAKCGLKANVAAKGDNKSIPARDSWTLTPGAKFVHYCDNETIGVRGADLERVERVRATRTRVLLCVAAGAAAPAAAAAPRKSARRRPAALLAPQPTRPQHETPPPPPPPPPPNLYRASSSRPRPTSATCRSSPTCRPTSSPSRSTCPSTR